MSAWRLQPSRKCPPRAGLLGFAPAGSPVMSQVCALRVRELTATCDLLSCFEVLRRKPYAWLLDSGAAPGAPSVEVSRYSFLGADPYLVLRSRGSQNEIDCRRAVAPGLEIGLSHQTGDPLDCMNALLPARPDIAAAFPNPGLRPPFAGGAVGYFGYELGEACEPVALTGRDDFGLPDLVLLFVDRLLAFDHVEQRVFAIGIGFAEAGESALAEGCAELSAEEQAEMAMEDVASQALSALSATGKSTDKVEVDWVSRRRLLGSALPEDAVCSFKASEYKRAVGDIRDEIAAGNVYQANLTQRIDLPLHRTREEPDADTGWRLYCALRRLSPAPFAAYLELPEVTIASSSPERFLCLDREGRVESRPIKGTRRRGASAEEDTLLAKELAHSKKDRAENLMIVDLVRNDLGRVCETGSVTVPELMAIEHYATVFQMVSTVSGQLKSDCSRGDLLRATFPPGSMTGAPKIAAMEIIDRIEPVRRGIYSGAIGYLDIAGGLDLSVVIRTLFVRNGQVHIHSGGAVVTDSVPADEYLESIDKVRALLAAVECGA
ncbi:MAG: para-aminobenzoate synthetase component 1 [Myxococcota bacterium]|jgi:para-aminobenzoate synthetase component 1